MKHSAIKTETKEVLLKLADSIQELTLDEYTERIPLLSNATIGEHTRHIIELFHQLIAGYTVGIINYDDRKRDLRLQENIDFAVESIASIISELDKSNKDLCLVTLYNDQEHSIESNFIRELMYNLEHCIHHQAIMKIALVHIHKMEMDDNFGVAKSTIAFRKQCVQ
jgi:hypothetical protein